MAGASDTRCLQFTVLQPTLPHINLCQITMFVQGRVIPYFGDVPVTFVEPPGPLDSPNKQHPELWHHITQSLQTNFRYEVLAAVLLYSAFGKSLCTYKRFWK
jgi:hypothetical protein